jgi:hypothetical protein
VIQQYLNIGVIDELEIPWRQSCSAVGGVSSRSVSQFRIDNVLDSPPLHTCAMCVSRNGLTTGLRTCCFSP